LRGINSQDLSNSVDLNIDYLHTFKPQQEWSISTQYSQNNLTNNFTSDLLGTSNDILSRQKNINLNTNKEFTVQTDYTTPLTKNQLLEFGVKGIFRQVNSNYEYLAATGNSSIYYNDATRPAGLLNYQQNVAAGYLSYTYTTDNKYTFKVGSRYEYTSITANDANSTISIPDYSNLVPSINVSKTFAGTTLKAAYNRRIQRPGLQQLNPNFNAANPQDIRIGNPNLSPELTDNFELGASTNINKTYINASVFARQTNNSISQIRVLSDTLSGALITTFQNIGRQQNYGANVFANIFITPKWSLNGGVDLLHTYLEGQAQSLSGTSYTTSNSGFVVSGRIMTSLSLTNGWGIQGFGFFRAQIQLQGTQSGFRMYSLGIKKDLPNQKGSIGIAAENFMTNGFVIATNLNSETFKQSSENKIYNSSVKLTFSYKIGKMNFSSPKKPNRLVMMT
jgi:outer membrane receptor protein involved in Fe transport